MNVDEEVTLACAFRYALGRRTYVVNCVVNQIIKHWDEIPIGKKELYKREIMEAIERDQAGDLCDIRNWRRILNLK